MTVSKPSQWLRAMNPIAKPRDRAEAERSARSFVIGSVIAILAGIPSTIWMFQSGWMATLMDAQYARMGYSASQIAFQKAIMDAFWPYAIVLGEVISVMLYGTLSFVQWRYMTRAIPVVLLAFSAYTLVAGIGSRLTGMAAEAPDLPLWVTILTWAGFLVQTVIYVASLQGAIMLHGLRQGAR